MNRIVLGIVGLVVTAALAGCAGKSPQAGALHATPTAGTRTQPPQMVTFPNGTTFGGVGQEASELAQIIAESRRMARGLPAAPGHGKQEPANLAASPGHAEQLSNEQGTGQITLFFPPARPSSGSNRSKGSGSSASWTISRARAADVRCSSCRSAAPPPRAACRPMNV